MDLLVTDVVMPNLGGRQLSEALAPICRKMRVLFMSGYTQNAIVQHGVLDPGLEFLAKPFNSRSLSERIREVLATPIRPRSVLLLDGDAAVTALLRDALEMKGYTVAIAADGADAVARCRQKPVDLLVVDAIAPRARRSTRSICCRMSCRMCGWWRSPAIGTTTCGGRRGGPAPTSACRSRCRWTYS